MKNPPEATPEMIVEAGNRFVAWLAEQPLSLSSREQTLVGRAWSRGWLDRQVGHDRRAAMLLESEIERDAYAEGFGSPTELASPS
jgi:hypothetical protein